MIKNIKEKISRVFRRKKNSGDMAWKPGSSKKRRLKVVLTVISIFLVAGGAVAWKTGRTLNNLSSDGNIFSNLIKTLPGVVSEVKGEEGGQINILVLGMRGENVPGGGLLADTIMTIAVRPGENKAAIISVPRDLYVTVPGTTSRQKINAVYHYGEQKGRGKGLEDMKQVVEEVLGAPIHYGLVADFKGFTDLVDSLGGIQLTLDEPFIEPLQFKEEHVCDEHTFTVKSGNFEQKIDHRGKVVARYPLCYNKNLECGGVFQLPAGDITLDGEQALCYVRSRKTSSDFARARRQQVVMQQIKEKALSLGTLGNFQKLNDILDSLGNNVKTDMQLWEMKRMHEIYSNIQEPQIFQKVLENSEEGLLYVPQGDGVAGYILLPRGDSYEVIHKMFREIFDQGGEKSA